MRLSAMLDAFENQYADPDTYLRLSFEDRFGMLVDKEWDKRKTQSYKNLFGMQNSVIRMCAWKPFSIIQTEIWRVLKKRLIFKL